MDPVQIVRFIREDGKLKHRKPNGHKKKNDTFGTINFQGFGQEASRNAPYVRVLADKPDQEKNKDIQDLWKLMTDYWKMPTPRLIISVTGGAQKFFMKRRLLNGFKRGLMKVATTAGAWIITGGTKTGVMEIVGEAAREYMLQNGLIEQNIVLLGIVAWDTVANKECLIATVDSRSGQFPCIYSIKDIPSFADSTTTQDQPLPLKGLMLASTSGDGGGGGGEKVVGNGVTKGGTKRRKGQERPASQLDSSLDPHHTHFVLVDNPLKKGYGGEIEYRAKLEYFISQSAALRYQNKNESQAVRPVPTVLLVLEGGQGTLKTVSESIKQNIPVVVIAGSGRAADLIDFASNNRELWLSDDSSRAFDETVRLLDIKVDLPSDPAKAAKNRETAMTCVRCLQELLDDFRFQDLVTIYRQTEDELQHDIDEAVMYALIKAQKNESNNPDIFGQLELALAWNRADIAKSELLTPERRNEWKEEEILYRILFDALVQDKHEFVS